MTSGSVRRGLHGIHAVTAVALILTGFLMLYPDLRARTIGGYGREIGSVHFWVGVVFGVAPVAAWLLVPRNLVKDSWRRVATLHAEAVWHRVHIIISLAASAVLILTGLILWLGADLPIEVWDAADNVHVYSHWIVLLSILVHLFAARRKITEHLRLALTGKSPELFEFADDPEDEP